jgi:hypothetical protein
LSTIRSRASPSLGSTSRIVFCVPKMQDRDPVNEVTLSLIVPTDQLAAITSMLAQPSPVPITRMVGEEHEEIRH